LVLNCVADPALAVVGWLSVGISDATIARGVSAPEDPFGVAKNSFAGNPVDEENVCVPLADMVVGEAVNQLGRLHVIDPIPLPVPVKVHIVPVQDTAGPLNVKAPGTVLMLVTTPLPFE
jgi:hypothetical protein